MASVRSSAEVDDDLFIVEVLPDHDEAVAIIQREYALELTLTARLDALKEALWCTHERQEPRLRMVSDLDAHYVMQCLDCGVSRRTISHNAVAFWRLAANLGRFDESLHDLVYMLRQDDRQHLERQIQQCRRAQYNAYLLTDIWREKRQERLDLDEHQCQKQSLGCLGKASQVHHRTYDRLFKEELYDLLSVCEHCHTELHRHANRQSA